jgi:multiple antibiotic resistance protein
MLQETAKTTLLIVAALLPILNPPAVGLIVLGMMPNLTSAERSVLASRIAINSLVLLLAALSVGAYVLNFFGISIPVLRVAGGLIIAAAGWRLLESPGDTNARRESEPLDNAVRAAALASRAFYPLTLPLTVGPGAIAVAIAIGSGTPRGGPAVTHIIGVAIALVLLTASIYVSVRFAGSLQRLLGVVGTQVAMRLFAFIIFCIGIQLLWLGASELLGIGKAASQLGALPMPGAASV